MYKLIFSVFLLLNFALSAVTIEPLKKIPGSGSFEYELIDLGATDASRELLSKYALPNTLAPTLNNLGQVVCNQSQKGFIKDLKNGEISPQITSIPSVCHGINNHGDLLLSFSRSPSDIEWWIWTQKNLRKEKASPIDLADLRGKNVYLRKINDNKMAVGSFKPAGMLRPMVWTPNEGLHHMGYYLGWDIAGVAYDVNIKGTVAGILENGEDNPPFTWNKKSGLEILKGYRYQLETQSRKSLGGALHFADLAIDKDNIVYGTFWIDDPTEIERRYQAYWWEPSKNEVRSLNLDGMRINAVNADKTLAGSWKGQAALCDIGDKPIPLANLIKNEAKGWELWEATDINDNGDIVGYGRFEDKTHIFLIKKKTSTL